MSLLKRLLVGRPLASEEARHQLLPKRLALPVFASDPLSSNAYATEEMLLVLAVAGAAAFWLVTPLSLVIAAVVVIVITSYRQTIHAYPGGGGSYHVARENLGLSYGLVAAAALLADYVLTVAVSVVAGVAAITSAAPALHDDRVLISTAFVALVAAANLRGVKESGSLFAAPTYLFVLSIWILLVAGMWRCLDGCPRAASADLPVEAIQPLTLFLVLRAFASGSTALTGIEAISNGVTAFRRPQAHNAATTMAVMGFLTLTMFLGLSFLARGTGVHPIDAEIAAELGVEEMTVVAQIAQAIFGGGFFFYLVQATTAGILILAANTAYADFPRLSSILARDRFMPRQFMSRGDRLVFSNGIIVLSLLAIALIVIFEARVTRLIQLYVIGVFTTFTLSQAGMVGRWRKLRPPRWRLKATLNGIGAATTGIVLIVVAATKFTHGGWIVMVAIPTIVFVFRAISRHYLSVGRQLRREDDRPVGAIGTRVVVLIQRVDQAAIRALGYARGLRPLEVRAVHVGRGDEAELVRKAWDERRVGLALDVVEGDPRDIVQQMRPYLRAMIREDEFVTVVVPEVAYRSRSRQLLHGRRMLLLKASLLFEPHVTVTDVTVPEEEAAAAPQRLVAPTRNIAIVTVPAAHNATLRALEYARALSPTDLRAVTVNLDHDETMRVLDDWTRMDARLPLEAIDSPYREVTAPLLRYIRALKRHHPDAVVTVILPEFVVRRWWHQFLHNQSALALKAALLFEDRVVVTSVPFHLR